MFGLGIGDVTHGYSRTGAENYRNDLNAKAITETCNKLRDTGAIENALSAGWQGQSELNFVTNLHNAVETTAQGIEELKQTLDGQFAAIEEAWANQDNEMVPLD